MRRLAVSLEALAERDNLVLTTWKAARGKHDRPAVSRFLANLDQRLASQGLLYCGHRITPGRILPSERKKRRYRAAAERLHRAEALGQVDARDLQRAHDAALGALAHTQSLHFRRGVWARLHNPDPGCPST